MIHTKDLELVLADAKQAFSPEIVLNMKPEARTRAQACILMGCCIVIAPAALANADSRPPPQIESYTLDEVGRSSISSSAY